MTARSSSSGISIRRLRVGEAELLQVWVSPLHRGVRLASDLIDTPCRWAVESDLRTIVATITAGNERAKQDFRPASERTPGDPGADIVLSESFETDQV